MDAGAVTKATIFIMGTASTGQRVDVVDFVNELRPSFAQRAFLGSRFSRSRLFFVLLSVAAMRMEEHDRHIRAIERHGGREWYKLSGCTKRSMVENAVYRYKAIIGPEMRARTLARQRVEHRIACEILNKMTALGMPDTYCAG